MTHGQLGIVVMPVLDLIFEEATLKSPRFSKFLKNPFDLLFGICRRLKVFVGVLKDFLVVLKDFVDAIF